MSYGNARSVFINKRGRYSLGERIAVVYCTLLGVLLVTAPIIYLTPLDETVTKTYRLLNPYLIKSCILIFCARIMLFLWSLSYRFKAFIHQSIGFRENESIFSLFLLLILTTAYISIGDIVLLLKNNITYTIKLSNGYFVTSLVMLIGIIYTLWRGILHAKRISRASIMHLSPEEREQNDIENFKDHISTPGGLF